MNPLLQSILGASGGGVLDQVASQFGLSHQQAGSAIAALLPALTGGIQSNVRQEGGIESLLGALMTGNHDEYLDDPSALASQDTVDDGNSILGHLLGSKDVSRQVAANAAAQTGLETSLMKQLLPIVATLAMGALSKQTSRGNVASLGQQQGSGGIMGMLSGLLDQNQDGSAMDDILKGVAGRMFGGR